MTKYLIPAVIVGVIVIAAVALLTTQNTPQGVSEQGTSSVTQESPTTSMVQAAYKDGTYSAVGNYVSPGGPRNIDVALTISSDMVTDATFTGHATDPNSMRFQGEFRDNFKAMVVGKSIDEIVLTKVSGSSLTPKGFMDALAKIKTEAKT